MLLSLRVLPRSSKNELIGPLADGSYKLKLTAAPVDGKANEALIGLLSKQFKVAKSRIKIVRGNRGKRKIIEISDF